MNVQACVNRGAKLLDKKLPGWAEKINLGKFRIDLDERCILGQLFNMQPRSGLSELGLDASEKKLVNYGFMADNDDVIKEYNKVWKETIKERREICKKQIVKVKAVKSGVNNG